MVRSSEPVKLVSENIMKYISDKQRYLICNPKYFLNLGSLTKSNNDREINRHSVGIELVNFNLTNSECLAAKRKEKKRCEKHIAEARKWSLANYKEPLSWEYIENLGRVVDPITNEKGFRSENVTVQGSRVSPPSYAKIHRELNMALLENETIPSPLERAIHAHFSIARIHPFNDGNGRTCRLVQDVILQRNGLPIPIIDLPERTEYIMKLEDAIYSYHLKEGSLEGTERESLERLREIGSGIDPYKQPELHEEGLVVAEKVLKNSFSGEQNYFYDFIALKVLDSLTDQLKRVYPSEKEMIKFLKKQKKSN